MMPSPFPGMDPYLENTFDWQGNHNRLITYIDAALNAVLPEPYASYTDVRCYIERDEKRLIVPDLAVQETSPRLPLRPAGSAAVLEREIDVPLTFRVYENEIREAYIEIRDTRGGGRVVTAIEILSITNKATGDGNRIYLKKQNEILHSETHLLEIDVLRAGNHTAGVPKSVFQTEHRYDYLVCLHRAGSDSFEVWLNRVRQNLPRVLIPLDAGVPDVVLDLQAVFTRFYDEGAYARKTDYRLPPVPPLTGDDAKWADTLLRERGLR